MEMIETACMKQQEMDTFKLVPWTNGSNANGKDRRADRDKRCVCFSLCFFYVWRNLMLWSYCWRNTLKLVPWIKQLIQMGRIKDLIERSIVCCFTCCLMEMIESMLLQQQKMNTLKLVPWAYRYMRCLLLSLVPSVGKGIVEATSMNQQEINTFKLIRFLEDTAL